MHARWLARLLVMALLLACASARAIPPIEHWRSARGVPVYFVRADAIPILDVRIDFDAGSRFDPPGREGLASMLATMIQHGAGDLDETALTDAFARTGARARAGAGTDQASVAVRTLTEPGVLARALELTALMIREPRFDSQVLARESARSIQSLRQGQTEPDEIARIRFDESLYPGHPYGRNASPDSVARIDAQDLRRFHRAHYVLAGASIVMVGAIDSARAHQVAEQLIAGLAPGSAAAEVPAVAMRRTGSELRVAHPTQQSHILIGTPVLTLDDPDYFALYVGNYVLGGGGFVSRLYYEVRETRGLAYTVYSHFLPLRGPGPFMIGLQTRNARVDEALEVVRRTVAKFVAEGPSDDELAAAKANLLGGFALKLDSNAKILAQLSRIAGARLPTDWLETWPSRVAAISREQVRDAFARRVQPAWLDTVVVGAQAEPAQARRP